MPTPQKPLPVLPVTGEHADHFLTWQERVWMAYAVGGTDADGNLRVDWSTGEETDMETCHVWCHQCACIVSLSDLGLEEPVNLEGTDQ